MDNGKRVVHPAALFIPIGFAVVGCGVDLLANAGLGPAMLVPRLVGRAMGLIACLSVLGFLVAVPVWFATSRNLRASTVAFCVTTGLVGLFLMAAWGINLLETHRRKASIARVENASRNVVREDGTVDGSELLAATTEAAETLPGTQGAAWSALQKVLGEQLALQQRYMEAIARATDSGVFDYDGAESVDDVRERRRMIAELRRLHAESSSYAASTTEHVREELSKLDISAELRTRFVAEFARGQDSIPREKLARVNEIERAILDAVDGAYSVLESNWGNWTVEDDGSVAFGDGVPAEDKLRFGESLSSIGPLYEEQQEIQRELAAMQR